MEIVILARAKQGHIYKYMKREGLTVLELSQRVGISKFTMANVLNFRWSRKLTSRLGQGGRRQRFTIERLEKFFCLPIDELYPLGSEKSNLPGEKEFYYDAAMLPFSDAPEKFLTWDPADMEHRHEDTMIQNIPKVLGTLTPREEKCLRLLFGLPYEDQRMSL